MSHTSDKNPKHWRSLAALDGDADLAERSNKELPILEPDPAAPSSVDRRRFLQVAAASATLAGLSPLAGCIRKPREEILPYSKRPENTIPGKAKYYATSMRSGAEVLGLLVESHDGRPTKIEGNPDSKGSNGATNSFAQATVWELYDPARSQKVLSQGQPSTFAAFEAALQSMQGAWKGTGGEGLGVLLDAIPSPTLFAQVDAFQAAYPKAQVFVDDAGLGRFAVEGLSLISGAGNEALEPVFDLDQAELIFALDCDFLGNDGDSVRWARGYGRKRNPEKGPMNRLYSAGPLVSLTSLAADHRLRLKGQAIPSLLGALAKALLKAGLVLPDQVSRELIEGIAPPPAEFMAKNQEQFVLALAEDLLSRKGKAAILVGERQPAAVHGLAQLLNLALGAEGKTLSFRAARAPFLAKGMAAFAKHAASLKSLVVLGANPLYSAPDSLVKTLKAIPTRIHLGYYEDESASGATWHLPLAHFLEHWGDLQDRDGQVLMQQPLIAPLFAGLSAAEFLARLRGDKSTSFELLRKQWLTKAGGESGLRHWVHDGVAPESVTGLSVSKRFSPAAAALALAWKALPKATAGEYELNLCFDSSVFDGRYAANGWLQELPDPVTKMTWDNAALIGPATAAKLGIADAAKPKKGVHQGPVLELTVSGRSLQVPAFVQPGMADGVVGLTLGYGRAANSAVAEGAGVRAAGLQAAVSEYVLGGLGIKVTGALAPLATTQDHNSMEDRPIVRSGALETFKQDPEFAKKMSEDAPGDVSLWTRPNETTGQQWGMNIDLGACIGCSACVIGCQSENNIPVVGKDRVLRGREMHWIRLDRYYSGDPEDPEGEIQPMACQQCENAPCESVCPVGATSHSPDGLNDMAYNRCIGTRYCSNNCPYKVRRFNFFNYNGDVGPVEAMQKNPDVTVRFRGVMEKCTYCVQRIQGARIDAKTQGESVIKDGGVTPACAQVCPTEAITFGDISDPNSAVSKAKASPRNYSVLGELNVVPRTTYLARIRNPNPRLG